MAAKRYGQLLGLIEQVKPNSIIEIGVWKGKQARLMALAALAHNARVHYIGYDLFEDATEETNRDELNAKPNCSLQRVRDSLAQFQRECPGFTFGLVKGNTRETLAGQCLAADFIYIDGGHSVETIRSDYEAVKASPVVVFDDYYLPDETGACADLERFGANALVDELAQKPDFDVEVLPSDDKLKGGGIVALAVVRHHAEAG